MIYILSEDRQKERGAQCEDTDTEERWPSLEIGVLLPQDKEQLGLSRS